MMHTPARRLTANDPAIAAVLGLIQTSFSYMEGMIDPPSSMHQLTVQSLRTSCDTAEVWVIGDPILACVILTPKSDHLYLGKLAVDPAMRGRGLARDLITLAAGRARMRNLPEVRLETRIELTANQNLFRHFGFQEIARSAHPGFDRPTSITFALKVPPPDRVSR